MVDHRAEDHRSFDFLTGSGSLQSWTPPGFVAKAWNWLDDLKLGGQKGVSRTPNSRNSVFWFNRVRTGRLAIGVCLIWVAVLAAYAFGFFSQVNTVEGGVNALPTLNLLFFAFAVVGPVTMIWFVAAMMNRAETLSEAITGQSESALALAATIDNLNDSLDAMASGTVGRLAQACDRMEERSAASVDSLQEALNTTSGKLDAALLDCVILLDTKLRERAEALTQSVSEQQTVLKQSVDENLKTIQEAIQAETDEFSAAQGKQSRHLEQSLNQASELLKHSLSTMETQQAKSLESANETVAGTCERIEERSAAGIDNLQETLNTTTGKLDTAVLDCVTQLDTGLREHAETLTQRVGEQQTALKQAVDENLQTVREALQAEKVEFSAAQGEKLRHLELNLTEASELLRSTVSALEAQQAKDLASASETIEGTCERIEERSAAGIDSLQQALSTTSGKLDAALLDFVTLLDTKLRERAEALTHGVSEQQTVLKQAVDENLKTIQEAMQAGTAELNAAQGKLSSHFELNLTEASELLKTTLSALEAQQTQGLTSASQTIEGTCERIARELVDTLNSRIASLDQQLSDSKQRITEATATTQDSIREDLGGALKALTADIEHLRQSIAARPPATHEDLAGLMGDAIQHIVSPERAALVEGVSRMTELEEKAQQILEQIDRTSRLAPMLADRACPETSEKERLPGCLFDELPEEAGRQDLNWTAVVHVLTDQDPVPGTGELIHATRRDPDIAELQKIRNSILSALAEHGLLPEDIVPEHGNLAAWAAWASGTRDERTILLAGVRGEIPNAIARGWLRQSSTNRVLAMRYIRTYRRLIERAAAAIGADGRLVEMADSPAGRIFILLGGLHSVFGTQSEAREPAHA